MRGAAEALEGLNDRDGAVIILGQELHVLDFGFGGGTVADRLVA